MKFRALGLIVGFVSLAAVGGGAYYAGLRQGTEKSVAVSPGKQGGPKREASTSQGETAPRAGSAKRPHPPAGPPDPIVGPYPAGKYTHFRVGNSNVKALFSDGSLMWIASSGGVIRYDTVKDEHRLFDVRSGLLSNGIFHISKINGRVVVGTYGGGLSLFDPAAEAWTNYNIQHGLADGFVYDVLQTSKGDIWIATWSGANRVRGGNLDQRKMWDTFTVKNTKGGLPNDWVYAMREGANGDIWMATEGGLALFRDGKWKNWQHEDGLGAPFEKVRNTIEFKRDPAKESKHHARQKAEQGLSGINVAYNPNYIVALEIDRDGSVWAGTWGGGLAHFDGKKFRNYTVSDGLPSNHVFLLHRDKTGRIWVGTARGLALMTNGRFKVFNSANGLFADNVFSMAVSERGNLWVGSYGGVARFESVQGQK